MSLWLLAAQPDILLRSEPIFHMGPVPFTNSMLMGLVGTAITFWLLFYTLRQASRTRPSLLATAVLWVFETLLGNVTEILGSRAAALRAMPLALSIFFFVIINNWLEILPVVGPVTWHGHPLLRGLSADLNFTAALAILTMTAAQLWGIRERGLIGNARRYFSNPFTNPMHAYEGFLELNAEIVRGIALALRLYGNIFGGEVLMLVVVYLAAWAAPLILPVFMLFELFIGAVQAYIFFMLAVVFISFGSAPSHDSDEPASLPAAAIAA